MHLHTSVPVQRFVLYGDERAEKWIIGCVELLELAKEKGEIPGNSMPGLPLRVVQGFKEWWESRKVLLQDEGFSYEALGERLPAPKIVLDPIHGDIKIVIGSLRFGFEQAHSAWSASVVITAPTRPGWSKTIARAKVSEPCLAEGELVCGVSIDGKPLYINEPPCLEIPLSDSRPSAWDVLIRYGGDPLADPKRFSLSKILPMTGVEVREGRVKIPLRLPELLGPNPIGRYTIYVRQRDRRRLKAAFGFTIVPDFWYQFGPPVGFPVGDGNSRVKLLVSLFEGAEFRSVSRSYPKLPVS